MIEPLNALREFVRREAGLAYDARPSEFAFNRLMPVARAAGLDDVAALADRVRAGDRVLGRRVVEAMTTHETTFFRDRTVFTFLEAVALPALRGARAATKRLRVWSAACSTGQEPYSLAMLLDEHERDFAGWCIEISATDLSGKAVEAARAGRYNQFEVQRGLSAGRLLRYFSRVGDDWRIAEHLRARVSFQTANLLDDLAGFGSCDLVFCRNVFIYFDAPTASAVLARLADVVAADGFLVVGASETLLGLTDRFVAHPAQPGVLVKRSAGHGEGPARSMVEPARTSHLPHVLS